MMQGYRTIVFNALMAVAALVRILFPNAVLPSDDDIIKVFEAVWAAVLLFGNVGLRFATKGPVGKKNPMEGCAELPPSAVK
jgi:hypothetical protein